MIDIGIYVNGESVFGWLFKLNYDDGSYILVYVWLFELCGKWNKDIGLYIDREDFKNGYVFYEFFVDFCGFGEEYINLICCGNIRLEFKFKFVIIEVLNVLVFLIYFVLLEISKIWEINYI